MRVYRVEHTADGRGPYQTRLISPRSGIHDDDEHPPVQEDIGAWYKIGFIEAENYYSGFRTLKQYHEWFRGVKKNLRQCCTLKVYEVEPKYVYGSISGRQLVFYRAKAKLIETRTI